MQRSTYLKRNNLGQIPTQRAIGTREIANVLKLVHLVHENEQLVIDAIQRLGENLKRLTGGAGLPAEE